MQRPDLTIREVDPEEAPDGRLCLGDHVAKKTWWDPDVGHRPNRFFMVSGRNLANEKRGIYCEECVARAHKMSAQSKQ